MRRFFLRVFHWPQGLDAARDGLLAGRHRHDVLEEAVRALEIHSADDTVGFNGFPNILGRMELDGAFMDGDTRMLGAVAALEHFLPVRVARKLMESGVHTLLVGSGAELFAEECGLEREATLSPLQQARWAEAVRPRVDQRGRQPLMDLVRELGKFKTGNFDTTVMIASDGAGMSAAASTSGWPYKFPGRVGDTAVAGAGLYVDSRFGGAACSFTGEMSMRTALARYMVTQMENGQSAREAVAAGIDDLSHIQGGLLRTLTLHAISAAGDAHVATINADEPVLYCYWREGMDEVETREAEAVTIEEFRDPLAHAAWRHLDIRHKP